MVIMEGGRSVLFDVSTYMLFEASGDSEAEYFAGAAVENSDATEDDAQSCSYGSSSDSARTNEVNAGGDDFLATDFGYCSEEGEEDGVVDQCCGGGKAPPPENIVVAPAPAKEKLNQSEDFEDSNVKLMNEETDRLFWEACLAS